MAFHHLHPADILLREPVVNHVRPVHLGLGVERGSGVVLVRRDQKPQVLPVDEVLRAVAAHAPVPEAVLSVGLLLVLPVSAVGPVLAKQRRAVRLNPVSRGVKPHLSRSDHGFHRIPPTKSNLVPWLHPKGQAPPAARFSADLPRGEPRGFAREGFWLGKVLIFHTEVFRVVLTDKPLWDRYLLRSQPSKPLTGQLRADGTLLGSIRSLFQEPGAKSNALLW
jgi:hypothetical protein